MSSKWNLKPSCLSDLTWMHRAMIAHQPEPYENYLKPIEERVQQLDEKRWLFGPGLVVTRVSIDDPAATWEDARLDCAYKISMVKADSSLSTQKSSDDVTGKWREMKDYCVGEVSEADLPTPHPLPEDGEVREICHDPRITILRKGVWQIGDAAVCKVTPIRKEVTPEHISIRYIEDLKDKRGWNFVLPKVLYHAEIEGYYFLFMERMRGRSLAEAWSSLDDDQMSLYCHAVFDIVLDMASLCADKASGVDGSRVALAKFSRLPRSFSPESFDKACDELGWNRDFRLYLYNLCPRNIFIAPNGEGSIGIIGWDSLGFVPLNFISTNFHDDTLGDWPPCMFRKGMKILLERNGYPNCFSEWEQWFLSKQCVFCQGNSMTLITPAHAESHLSLDFID